MPTQTEVDTLLTRTDGYLKDLLLPFWLERAPDSGHGGFLTYFDGNGHPTGETDKTLLMQIRMLYTLSSAHRAGYGRGRCAELAEIGADFILSHYWDDQYGGWFWTANRSGQPIDTNKIGYGQCFALYAFSEYYLATGDDRGREAAEKTYEAIHEHMLDPINGGYKELMLRDWQALPAGRSGGDRKSLDVHMHMMEALTTFFEMTRDGDHRDRLTQLINLIIRKMLRRKSATGYLQFTWDFRPVPAILFETEWGRDAVPKDGRQRPLTFTSYGHNVEFAWLLRLAAEQSGLSRQEHTDLIGKICDHCIEFGIDWEHGGVFTEGPFNRSTGLTDKQFWQQAEVMVGMLEAYVLLGKDTYWHAFKNVYDFVFTRFVNFKAGGEWFERVDRLGNPVDDALAHAWKVNYHTVRSMIQTIQRLRVVRGSSLAA